MQLSKLKVNCPETLGRMYLIEEPHVYEGYKEGIKTGPEGLVYTVMSEMQNFDKFLIKIPGTIIPTVKYQGSPVPVEFEGLEGKLWQDFRHGSEIKLSISAKAIRIEQSQGKSLKLNEK